MIRSSIHTIIRDRTCAPDEFVFQTDRLGRLVIDSALSQLNYSSTVVHTPTKLPFAGAKFAAKVKAPVFKSNKCGFMPSVLSQLENKLANPLFSLGSSR